MYQALDVVRRAGDVLNLVGSGGRKRAVLLGGLNVAAAALALGALHLGGAIVEGARNQPQPFLQPSPEAIVKAAAKVSAPVPHPAPALLAAVPDAVTLFAAPIVEPTAFVGGTTAEAGDAPANSPSPVAPSLTHSPAGPQPAGRVIRKAAKLPKTAVETADTAVLAAAGPLVLTDGMLDANGNVGISVGPGSSVAATATASVGASVAAATGAATGVAGAVSSAVSGVAGAVGSAVGAR